MPSVRIGSSNLEVQIARERKTMRRAILLLIATITTLVLASGVALAVNKIGTAGHDTLKGTNKSDNLLGKGGNDILYGLGGRDSLLGGPGKDVLLGGNERRPLGGDKNLVGGSGNDAVFAGQGSDNAVGEEGNDWLVDGAFTESSKDKLSGGDGNDVLDAINKPAFGDTIVCGRGFDRVLTDRKDEVAPDCEKVAVGFAAAVELFESIPKSFFDGLNPEYFG